MGTTKKLKRPIVGALFNRHPILWILILGVCGVSAITFYLANATENLVETVALEDAALYSQAIEEFRTVYTSEVVAIVREMGIEVSHDYKNKEHAIPLPATLSMILGRRIGEHKAGAETHLYSAYPFPWREEENKEIFKDPFSWDAWEFLTANPEKPFYRFEELGGRRVLRYARADLMRPSCVTCHNTHPDTPKSDWKEGDVRGVLQVDLPLTKSIEASRAAMQGVIILVVVIGGLGLAGTWLFIGKIRRNEAELDSILLNLPVGVAVLEGPELRYFRINQALAKLNGLPVEDHLGKPLAEVMPDAAKTLLPVLQSILETGEPNLGRQFSIRLPSDPDKARHLMDYLFPIMGTDGKPKAVGAVVVDVTERKELEEKLLQSQKMEAIGTLAGGIAHDFNNILLVIMGHAELLEDEIGAYEHLDDIQKSAQHASDLTRRLLTFSRHQAISFKVVDLNESVLQMEKMLRRIIGADIELVVLPSDDPYHIRIDPGQFEQVLLNLAINSREAMGAGGKLTMRVHRVTRDGAEQAVVSVIDTGAGMSHENQEKMFDPFFTTKEVGKGTGLGLSICYGIVRQSGGHFEVVSEPGEGTTIRMYFPIVEEKVQATSEPQPKEGTVTGTETILLVEDEPAVRALGARALREKGYTVLEAGNGEEALSVLKNSDGSIDAMITDMVMPRMGGRELIERVHDDYPHVVKILCTSGYAGQTEMRAEVIPNLPCLQKPYRPSVLLQKIRDLLR